MRINDRFIPKSKSSRIQEYPIDTTQLPNTNSYTNLIYSFAGFNDTIFHFNANCKKHNYMKSKCKKVRTFDDTPYKTLNIPGRLIKI